MPRAILRCEKCNSPLSFQTKDYRAGTATYDCEKCGIRYEFERTRDSRILGEKWEPTTAKKIHEEKKGA